MQRFELASSVIAVAIKRSDVPAVVKEEDKSLFGRVTGKPEVMPRASTLTGIETEVLERVIELRSKHYERPGV